MNSLKIRHSFNHNQRQIQHGNAQQDFCKLQGAHWNWCQSCIIRVVIKELCAVGPLLSQLCSEATSEKQQPVRLD